MTPEVMGENFRVVMHHKRTLGMCIAGWEFDC